MDLCDIENCTGCEACYNVCPKNAISFKKNKYGFGYPVINDNKCINCGICNKSCPQINAINREKTKEVYASLAIDDKVRNFSSSGGIFTLISEYILKNNGIVFGAALTENLTVKHIYVDKKEDLYKLRGSKYVQSNIGQTYKKAKDYLLDNRPVLFSGTPCQIAGIISFLGSIANHPLFFTVDLLCHGVPSPKVFSKYITDTEKQHNKVIRNVTFKSKTPGWKNYGMIVYFNDETKILNKRDYLNGFLSDFFLRESCYNCQYIGFDRVSDMTIGDYWGYKESNSKYIEDDDRGISAILINTQKGKKIFNRIKKRMAFEKRTFDDVKNGNQSLKYCCVKPKNYDEFWAKYDSQDWLTLANEFFPSQDVKDNVSVEDRIYYSQPYKKRHLKHVLRCEKNKMLKFIHHR